MLTNIRKLYLANFLAGFALWNSVEKLFMHSIHITNLGIAITVMVVTFVTLMCDVPFGVLADKWGRKNVLLIGMTALGVSSFILGQSNSLGEYLYGSTIFALCLAMNAGTYQAIMYDTLAEAGREKEYVKYEGRSYGIFFAGVTISAALGGYIAHAYGYRAAYYLTILPAVIGLLVLSRVREPNFHKEENREEELWPHIKTTFRLIMAKKLLVYLSLLFVGALLLAYVQTEYSGLYFIALGYGAIGNGLASAGMWLFTSLGLLAAYKLTGYTRFLIPCFFLAFLALTLFRSQIGLVFFIIAPFIFSIVSTNVENVIQKNIPSSHRATTLSMLSFTGDGLFIPVSLVFGLIARQNVFNAFMFVAIIGLVFAVTWLTRPRSVRAIDFGPDQQGAPPAGLSPTQTS